MIAVRSDCRLVFCVGVGGVGKTTFAASLALNEAVSGRSVLVLTADPARRLADALGVGQLVDSASVVSLPGECEGQLHAAMLETKASADEIIRRASADPERAQRVLDNKIYQAFSNTLARSHAYAAMERVHAAIHDDRYDLVIVDTPPAQSAMEILDAPARLVRFLDQRVVRWFLQGAQGTHDARLRGGALTRRLLTTIAGRSLVDALTGFLSEMAFLREGFALRATEVRDIMRTSATEFVLVSSADASGIAAARSVAREVEARGFALGHTAINRAFIPEAEGVSQTDLAYPDALADLQDALDRSIDWVLEDQSQRRAATEGFQRGRAEPVWALPESARPLGDPTALRAWVQAARRVARVS
ncbi:MAG: ArsA-related P-loop ATPase [Myxococcota bacterium]